MESIGCLNDQDVEYPLEFYNFFKQIDCHFIQFAPIVERIVRRADGLSLASSDETGGQLTPYNITAEQWGDFLCDLFDERIKADVATYFIQLFDATLSGWVGVLPGVCTLAQQCGHAGVMEWNGDVYSCDHFSYQVMVKGR